MTCTAFTQLEGSIFISLSSNLTRTYRNCPFGLDIQTTLFQSKNISILQIFWILPFV